MRKISFYLLIMVCGIPIHTLATHDWMVANQVYYRIDVVQDGMYRIPHELLVRHAIPVEEIPGNCYRLFHLGREVPLYRSTNKPFGSEDFLEFFGRKNRDELDSLLFDSGTQGMLNPYYSLFTDTSAYFLTWSSSPSDHIYVDGAIDGDCTAAPPSWVWQEQLISFQEVWHKASYRVGQVSMRYSHFDHDGFASPMQSLHKIRLLPEQLVGTGPDALLDLRLLSNDNTAGHQLQVSLRGKSLTSATFSGSRLQHLAFRVPPDQLSASPVLEIAGTLPQDRYAVGFVRLRYPAAVSAGHRSFWSFRLAPAVGCQRMVIADLQAPSGQWLLLDLQHNRRYEGSLKDKKVQLVLADSRSEQPYLLYTPEHITAVSKLYRVNPIDFSRLTGDFAIITHPRFLAPGGPAETYAGYRSSRFRPFLVNIEQLYDQFSYGIRRHPYAIRAFIQYLHAAQKVKYILLLGKGQEYPGLRHSDLPENALIPTWGYPASDLLLAPDATGLSPLIPIGRIAATQPEQVLRYLNKLREFESSSQGLHKLPQQSWRKQVLHLSGGAQPAEQQLLANHLSDLGRLLRESAMGARIFAVSRAQSFDSQAVFDRINSGLAMITFLGHSAPGTFDSNIDNPERYHNRGKYPFLLSLGCYSGNIFTPQQSLAERFCFLENAGTIAFAASSGPGFLAPLTVLGREIYQNLGQQLYGKGLGDILQQSTRNLASGANDILLKSLLQQFVFHGDPAILLHPFDHADYTIDPDQMRIAPAYPTQLEDSIHICLEVYNLGRSVPGDSLQLELSFRRENDPEFSWFSPWIPAPASQTTLCYALSIDRWKPGRWSVSLQLLTNSREGPLPAALYNNQLRDVLSFDLVQQQVVPLAPSDAAIFTGDTLHLQAFGLPGASGKDMILFELDTTPTFNSPLYHTQTMPLQVGLLSWKPNVSLPPCTTLFWKVSTAELSGMTPWSFTWKPGTSEGWLLQHPQQIRRGQFVHVSPQDWNFTQQFREIRLLTHPGQQHAFSADGQPWAGMWIWEVSSHGGGVQVLAINPRDGTFMLNASPGLYGSVNHFTRWPLPTFAFDTSTPTGAKALANFLQFTIPNDYYILLYTGQLSPQHSYFPLLLRQAGVPEILQQQGATRIHALNDTLAYPYLFYYRKNKGPIYEAYAGNTDQPLVHTHRFPFFRSSGEYISPTAGPASRWSNLVVQLSPLQPGDRVSLLLEAPTTSGSRILHRQWLQQPLTNINLDFINEHSPPLLQTRLILEDSLHRSPVRLQSLQINYEGLPDILFADQGAFPDTLEEGDPFIWQGTITNAGTQASDSIAIRYQLSSTDRPLSSGWHTIAPLAGNSSRKIQLTIPTSASPHPQELQLDINPRPSFLESNTLNNQWKGQFFVRPDKDPPRVEAYLDGQPWRGKPVTGTRPQIRLVIRDKHLVNHSTDTPAVQLLLQTPETGFEPLSWTTHPDFHTRIDPGNPQMLQLEWNPLCTTAGSYHLRIIVRDKSSRTENLQTQSLTFEVLTQAQITECWNYPNPFSQYTRFVFALGGDQPVLDYRIQIFTNAGRFVRELTANDLGHIQPGIHPSEQYWDGTDSFGDPLAPGIYFYRVFVGETQIQPGKHSYFDKGIGKLVILR